MNPRRSTQLLLVLSLILSTPRAVAGGTQPAARPFVPLAAPKAQVDTWKRQLCARPEFACAQPSDLRLYRVADDPAATVWATIATAPVLLKLRHGSGSAWSVLQRWDFSGYIHSHPPDAPSYDPMTVYPALYPAGPDLWAVALVSDVHEYYSGGWATFSYADFLALPEPADAGVATAALYRGVMFSCGKAIRACFTEEDYRRRGRNCHDEYRGFLTLEYAPSAASARYAWTAVWHEEGDGSRHAVPLPAKGGDVTCLFANVAACGGGPVTGEDDPCSQPR
jgi:hypothetical protein